MKTLRAVAALVLMLCVLSGVRPQAPSSRWEAPVLFPGVLATYFPTPVKSVQQVSITIGTSSATGTATVTSVTPAASLLVFQGTTTADTNPYYGINTAYGTITNATTVTATRGFAFTLATTVYNAVLVEFLPQFVKSQKCGTRGLGARATAATGPTASAVVPTKTVVANTGWATPYDNGLGA